MSKSELIEAYQKLMTLLPRLGLVKLLSSSCPFIMRVIVADFTWLDAVVSDKLV